MNSTFHASPEPLNVTSLFTQYLSTLHVVESVSSDLFSEAHQVLANAHRSISTDHIDTDNQWQRPHPQDENKTLQQNGDCEGVVSEEVCLDEEIVKTCPADQGKGVYDEPDDKGNC